MYKEEENMYRKGEESYSEENKGSNKEYDNNLKICKIHYKRKVRIK